MVDLGALAERVDRHLDHYIVQHPSGETNIAGLVLSLVLFGHDHACSFQLVQRSGPPILDELVLAAAGYHVRVLPAERLQLALELVLGVVAFGVGVEVTTNGLAVEVRALGQLEGLMAGVHVALELTIHAVEARRGHVRVVVPRRYEVEVGAVRIYLDQLRYTLGVQLISAGALSDRHRSLDHTRAIQNPTEHHLAHQRLVVAGGIWVDVLELVVNDLLHAMRNILGRAIHELVESFLRRLGTGVIGAPVAEQPDQRILGQVGHRRRVNPPVLLAGRE